jgi:hypothetical protein
MDVKKGMFEKVNWIHLDQKWTVVSTILEHGVL